MKLSHPEITTVLDFSKNRVVSLIIENQKFYYNFVMDIVNQINGDDGDSVLSLKDKEVSVKKYCDFIINPIELDINSTSLITKVNSKVEQIAVDEFHFEKTQQMLSQIETIVDDILLDFDANFYCDRLSITQIIKACGIKAEDVSDSFAEKIYNYVNLNREFLGDKLFVFANVRSFISDKEYMDLVETLNAHAFYVLFLENKAYPVVDGENRIIIDADLCEI